jgi:hypothetical protein
MKTTLVLILFLFAINISNAQYDTLEVTLNYSAINQFLLASPHEINVGIGQSSKSETIVYLPYKDGNLKAFKLIEYDIVPAALRKEIKTYYGQMLDDPTVDCRLTLANGEIRVNFNGPEGTIALERNVRSSSTNAYWLYKVEAILPTCGVEEHQHKNGRIAADHAVMFNTHGTQLRTYRLALLITSGFYTAGGGTNAAVNTYIATIVNNLNGIYEKEIAVRFTLVSPNNPVSSNVFSIYDTSIDLTNANTELNARYGSANFDVGHLLLPSGGGVAQLGSVCGSSKGRARSGVSSVSNVFVFAHELGHQFNAGHTFNGNGSGNCGPSNRMNNDAYEPGSGNTIMSYSNLCSPSSYNIVGGSLLYFHTHSQESMITFIKSPSGSCGVVSNSGNAVPVVAALTGFTIPRNTPFTLTGTATDANSDPLTYTWEQYNLAAVADTGRLGHTANTLGTSAVNSPTAPLFRTVQSSNPTRNFPNLTYVLNNANNPPDNIGEDLPNVARTLNFRLTARDNRAGGGGVSFGSINVVVDATKGPLTLNAPNGGENIVAGNNYTVTWAVNSTNILSANIKILLSTDGGSSFPFVLLASTANDGSQSVSIPSNVPNTTQARIKIASLGIASGEFFDVSNANFTINSACLVAQSLICNDIPLTANQGSSSLNLNLSYIRNGLFQGGSKSYDNTSIVSRSNILHTTNNLTGCISNNSVNSKMIPFRVSQSGNYTFSINNNAFIGFSVFNSQTINCANFVGGNRYLENNTTWTYSSRTLNLSECITYYILVYINSGFTLNINGIGNVNEVLNLPSGFSYTFAAIGNASNQIVNVSSAANFTSLNGGIYKISGLMYPNALNPNTLIGNTIEQVYNSGNCILFSANTKPLTVIGLPCPTILTLVSPTDDILNGQITKLASITNGKINASNKIINGVNPTVNYQAKSIELQPGFIANSGTVFTAAVGGCN